MPLERERERDDETRRVTTKKAQLARSPVALVVHAGDTQHKAEDVIMKMRTLCGLLYLTSCLLSAFSSAEKIAFATSLLFDNNASRNTTSADTQIENALQLLRSVKLTVGVSTELSLYACYSGAGSIPAAATNAFSDIKATLVPLHQHPWDVVERNTESFKKLRCGLQVADYLYRRQIFDANVLHIGSNMLMVSDISSAMQSIQSKSQPVLACSPPAQQLNGSLCDWDLFVISSAIGTPMYSYFNASLYQKAVMPSDVFVSAAGALSATFQYLSTSAFYILRGNKAYHVQSDEPRPLLIEFDGSLQTYKIARAPPTDTDGPWGSCHILLHLEYSDLFTSAQTISALMAPFYEPTMAQLLGGCAPFRSSNFDVIRPLQLKDFGEPTVAEMKNKKRIVYDTFLFNDELSMLALRLEVLQDVVDFHVLIESNCTFTGASKPLYFAENSDRFRAYRDKIIHIIIPRLLNPEPKGRMDVWNNEYYSRNSVIRYLSETTNTINDEDIIIVADVDEIPHPDGIRTLHSIYQHEGSHEASRAYTFKVDTYIYSFECYVRDKVLQYPQVSAATLRVAKHLAAAANKPDEPATSVRYHHKYDIPQPFDSLISPGGWHLSFFLNMNRIRRKLESYSHQNFKEEYMEDVVDFTGNGEKQIKKLSTEKILNRILAGEHLGSGKNAKKCDKDSNPSRSWPLETNEQESVVAPLTKYVKELWEHKYSTAEDTPLLS